MGVVKKAFDNDKLTLDEYLKTIRQLAKQQCRTIIKTNRLIQGTGQPMIQPQDSYLTALDPQSTHPGESKTTRMMPPAPGMMHSGMVHLG